MKTFALLFLAIAASGCPDIQTDPADESPQGPSVEFDPANRIIPFPNNLLIDRTTGKVTLPAQCLESPTAKALRENVLNKLDGFGVFEGAMNVTFTKPVDKASLEANLVMYKRATAGTPVDPGSAQPVMTRVIAVGTSIRFDANCANPAMIDSATIVPLAPLEQKSTYVVALRAGVKTSDGTDFAPSFTWSLVRSAENPAVFDEAGNYVADRTPLDPNNPVQLEQLKGINLLWNAHAQGLAFLKAKGTEGSSVLLAWEFNTQTTTDPLDAAVAGSPASMVAAPLGLAQAQSVLPTGVTAEQFLISRLPPNSCSAQGGPLPCQAVGDILGGGLLSRSYQVETPNPVQGNCSAPSFLGCPIPGPWPDAVRPAVVKTELIETLVTVPQGAPPANGWPTVIFGHGLGQSKTNVFGIAPQLSALGFAVVAIDEVAHDSRAVRISNTPNAIAALSCADVNTGNPNNLRPPPTQFPFCYASFLSANLGATRDNIRQTILDTQTLLAALKTCNATPCGGFKPDAARIMYLGQSLGGIQGSTFAATTDLKAAVLNVPGVGWADIFENTQTLPIRCQLVDGLIDAGILTGAKSNLLAVPPTGLCTTEEWKTQPGYRQFSLIGRWVLDPADPANFTRRLAMKRFMIQEVVGDTVVPNIATGNEGMLTGRTPANADPCVTCSATLTASAAVNPAMNLWVRYPTLPPVAGQFPGNTFNHGSLLRPATTVLMPPVACNPGTGVGCDGNLGTARMQVDALVYLNGNK